VCTRAPLCHLGPEKSGDRLKKKKGEWTNGNGVIPDLSNMVEKIFEWCRKCRGVVIERCNACGEGGGPNPAPCGAEGKGKKCL